MPRAASTSGDCRVPCRQSVEDAAGLFEMVRLEQQQRLLKAGIGVGGVALQDEVDELHGALVAIRLFFHRDAGGEIEIGRGLEGRQASDAAFSASSCSLIFCRVMEFA